MKLWKPTADEKRAIRAVAAASEKRSPQSIILEIGERFALTRADNVSFNDSLSINLLAFPGELEGLDNSDLNQTLGWSELDAGVPLTSDGRAIVDFYVYEKVIGDHGDLLTNVQAHVETVEGKPMLVKVTGTGIPDVTGETLVAFMHPEKERNHPGTDAFYKVKAWRAKYAEMWKR